MADIQETETQTWVRPVATSQTTRGALVASAGVVGVLVIAAKLIGFLRDRTLATHFGAGSAMDAYVVASAMPNIFIGALGAAIGTGLLPVLAGLLVKGQRDEAKKVASTVLNLTLAVCAGLALIAVVAARPLVNLMAVGFNQETAALAVELTRIIFIFSILSGLAATLGLVINSLKSFTIPALGPVVLNIVTIGTIMWLARDAGIYAAAYGLAAGTVVQFSLQYFWLRRLGMPMGLHFDLGNPAVRRAIVLALPILASTVVSQAFIVVDKRLASGLTPGSISALSFANKLVLLPLSVFVSAVSTVIFPTLAERASAKDTTGLADTITFGLRSVAMVIVPAAVGLAVLSVPIIRVLFQQGAFDARATTMTSAATIAYAIGMLPAAANAIPIRAFQGMQDTFTPLAVGALGTTVNIILDLALVGPLGIFGLGLANSLTAFLNFSVYYYLINRRVSGLPSRKLVVSLGKIAVAAGVMGFALVAGIPVVGRLLPAPGLLAEAMRMAVLIALGGLVYALALVVLRLDEMKAAGSMAGRAMRRLTRRVQG